MFIEQTRILLVEDDPNDVALLELALSQAHLTYQLDVAEDGEQALSYLLGPEQRPLPRLVLLDLKLPKLSGLQVLRAIRSQSRTRSLVVVVLSSSAESQDIQACYDLGVNSYIVKPITFQNFFAVAQQVGTYWMTLNQVP